MHKITKDKRSMKKIPFFNKAPNCLVNCMVMAMLYLKPWLTPDHNEKTWEDPFSNPDWMPWFLQQLGLGPHSSGMDKFTAIEFLEDYNLSGFLGSPFHMGFRASREIMNTINWYDEAPYVLIVSLEYSRLPQGRPGNHAVIITDVDAHDVWYHDPALENGQNQICDRSRFEKAQRMYNYSTRNIGGSSTLTVVWDQDKYPDLYKAMDNLKQSKSQKKKVTLKKNRAKSTFTIYQNPIRLLQDLEKEGIS
jgi:hypothetical protein